MCSRSIAAAVRACPVTRTVTSSVSTNEPVRRGALVGMGTITGFLSSELTLGVSGEFRQSDAERRSDACRAGHTDRTAMRLDELADDRETQPAAARGAAARLVRAPEPVEHVRQIVLGD